jgi:hypothetical protein
MENTLFMQVRRVYSNMSPACVVAKQISESGVRILTPQFSESGVCTHLINLNLIGEGYPPKARQGRQGARLDRLIEKAGARHKSESGMTATVWRSSLEGGRDAP